MAKALIVVDVQKDFCEGGSLPVGGGALCASNISAYIHNKHEEYAAVAFTKDWHFDPGNHWSNTPDFKDSWPPHCAAGKEGSEFHPNLRFPTLTTLMGIETPEEIIFKKGHNSAAYSGFEAVSKFGLRGWLDMKDITEVDVCGIALDYCVKATAMDAAEYYGYKTNVLIDLTAAVSTDADELLKLENEFRGKGIEVVQATLDA